jgi:small subunit ribosomal protein S11
MGKKRIIKKSGSTMDQGLKSRALAKATKKKLITGKLYVEATYNNTKVSLTDTSGNVVIWSSSGALGFKGAKKGTPFAASKVGDLVGEKAAIAGIKTAEVVITGVGSGRESAVRALWLMVLKLTISKTILLYLTMVQSLKNHVVSNFLLYVKNFM